MQALSKIHAEAVKLLSNERASGTDADDDMTPRLTELRVEAAKIRVGAGEHAVSYPSTLDVNFEKRLLDRFEFAEHASSVADITDSASADADGVADSDSASADADARIFELTRAQIVVRNFMAPGTPYNSVLLFHGVGVGKTCAAIVIAEMYARSLQNGVTVVTRRALVDNFKRALFDPSKVPVGADGAPDYTRPVHCAGTVYSDAVRDKSILTLEQVDARIMRKVNEDYTFHSPVTFANEVDALLTDASGAKLPRSTANKRIRDRFSRSVLIVDEAHNLRGSEAKQMAAALKRVVSTASNVKLVLMTATPMFNSALDIIPLVNMMLVNDARPTLSLPSLANNGVISAQDAAKLGQTVRGYVSYMPGNDPMTFPMRLSPRDVNDDDRISSDSDIPSVDIFGRPIPVASRIASPLRDWMVHSTFSPGGEQRRVCDELSREITPGFEDTTPEDEGGDDEEEGGDAKKERGGNFQRVSMLMQAQNIVYPGGDIGGKGFTSAFRVRKDTVEYMRDSVADGGAQRDSVADGGAQRDSVAFLSPALIATYAPKLASIVKRVGACEGVSIVYSRYIRSGLIPLAVALEHAGFNRFMGAPIMASASASAKKGRGHAYAIISSSTFASPLEETLRVLESAENANGERIRVVLISDKGSEGITIKHAREVHVMEPWFHLNKLEQVVGRGARFRSHSDLPLERRNLTVYYHAMSNKADRPGGALGSSAADRPGGALGSSAANETLDMYMYRISGNKQKGIDKVEQILKERAFDCNLHAPYRARLAAYLQKHKVDVRTSQGVVLPNRVRPMPEVPSACLPVIKLDGARSTRDSYNPRVHGHGEYRYKIAISKFFGPGGRVAASDEQLWEHVQNRVPHADEQRMYDVLGTMLAEKTVFDIAQNCGSGSGRYGYLIRRGWRYLFQPLDEGDVTYLLDTERSTAASSVAHRIGTSALRASRTATSAPASAPASGPASLSRSRGGTRRYDIDSILSRIERFSADILAESALPPKAKHAYSAAATDAAVDRLDAPSLMSLCVHVLNKRASGAIPRDVASSLSSAGVILPSGDAFRIPFAPDMTYELDADSKLVEKLTRGPAASQKQQKQQQPYLVVMDITKKNVVVFKVRDNRVAQVRKNNRGAVRSGCVCHQTNMSQEELRAFAEGHLAGANLSEAVAKTLAKVTGKREMCSLFELLVRKHLPDAIARPLRAVHVR